MSFRNKNTPTRFSCKFKCIYLIIYSSSEPTITESDYLPDNIEVMTPIIDGLRRLSEDTETEHESEHELEPKPTVQRHYSTDTTSTDTFQTNDSNFLDARQRKTSRTEDLSSLRNLSTNGLNMFDPLVINAAGESSRPLPDHDLVTSLNEQVTEIADRLSSIVADVDMVEHNHSFSTNDVPTLIATDEEAFAYSGPRNEQLSCLPSTSHGYLIPNAISQEPVVLSLSHNNSAVFNQEEESNGANNDLPLIIPDNIDSVIVNTNISIANANLSSLLLTNEEFRHNFIDNNDDNNSFHSASMTMERNEDERVKFMLGYESDHESPVDSGVSTENASLDRSPDTESKNIKENHFMEQNRVLKSPDGGRDKDNNVLESSFSDVNNDTVNFNYVEDDTQKNEAGSSSVIEGVNIRLSDNEATNSRINEWVEDDEYRSIEDVITEIRRHKTQEEAANSSWGTNRPQEEYRSIDEVITELRRQREDLQDNNTNPEPSQSSTKKKTRKGSKSKRKKKMWSPGIVIIDNRASQNSPLKLNLDHLVDER